MEFLLSESAEGRAFQGKESLKELGGSRASNATGLESHVGSSFQTWPTLCCPSPAPLPPPSSWTTQKFCKAAFPPSTLLEVEPVESVQFYPSVPLPETRAHHHLSPGLSQEPLSFSLCNHMPLLSSKPFSPVWPGRVSWNPKLILSIPIIYSSVNSHCCDDNTKIPSFVWRPSWPGLTHSPMCLSQSSPLSLSSSHVALLSDPSTTIFLLVTGFLNVLFPLCEEDPKHLLLSIFQISTKLGHNLSESQLGHPLL